MLSEAGFSATAYWLLALWLFAAGGIIGSFLNVVVYRLPAGLSIVMPGSHCPRCKRHIRWFDNVPVLSWLLLGGRCRDCHEPISLRYPLVEAATALLFLAVGGADYFRTQAGCYGGWPPSLVSPGVASSPAVVVPQATDILHVSISCVFHLVLLCTLFAAALIEYDEKFAFCSATERDFR